MKSGTATGYSPSRLSPASCSMISMPVARPPGDRHALRRRLGQEPLAGRRDRPVRVLVDRTAGDVEVRDRVVEEADQRAHQPALGLPLLAEEENVVAGDEGDVDLRDDG